MRLQSITALVLTLSLPSAAAAGVAWQSLGVDEAIARGRQERKPILIEFFATWCGPCQQLDAQVWSREDVAAEIRDHYVAIRLDGETGAGPQAMRRFHVVGFPTTLVVGDDGNEIDRIFGVDAPAEFLLQLRNLRQGIDTVQDLEERLARTPDDLRLRFDVGSRWAIRGDERRALKHLDVVVRRDAQNGRGLAAKTMLTLGNYLYLRGQKNYARALSTLEQLRRIHPRAPEATSALYPMARALHGLNRDDDALRLLDEYVASAPRDADRYNSFAWFCFKENVAMTRGEQMARRGLEIDPRSDSLWDTLAELLNALGRPDEAVEAEQRAQQIKPDSPYYRDQLTRFRTRAAAARPRRGTARRVPAGLVGGEPGGVPWGAGR